MAQQPSTMSTIAVSVKQGAVDRASQIKGRAGVASANPPSTSLPASVRLESDAPPPIPSTGVVPFMTPMQTPRVAANARTANNTPPNLSVNVREDFISEASAGHVPLSPTLIAAGSTGQIETGLRPNDSDKKVIGTNVVGSGPIINPQQPTVTMPIVNAPLPERTFE